MGRHKPDTLSVRERSSIGLLLLLSGLEAIAIGSKTETNDIKEDIKKINWHLQEYKLIIDGM